MAVPLMTLARRLDEVREERSRGPRSSRRANRRSMSANRPRSPVSSRASSSAHTSSIWSKFRTTSRGSRTRSPSSRPESQSGYITSRLSSVTSASGHPRYSSNRSRSESGRELAPSVTTERDERDTGRVVSGSSRALSRTAPMTITSTSSACARDDLVADRSRRVCIDSTRDRARSNAAWISSLIGNYLGHAEQFARKRTPPRASAGESQYDTRSRPYFFSSVGLFIATAGAAAFLRAGLRFAAFLRAGLRFAAFLRAGFASRPSSARACASRLLTRGLRFAPSYARACASRRPSYVPACASLPCALPASFAAFLRAAGLRPFASLPSSASGSPPLIRSDDLI